MSERDRQCDLIRRASLEQQAGHWNNAIETYRRLLHQWPDLPDSWYNLGRLQSRIGAFADALSSYQFALERGIERPEEVHLNRSVIFADGLRQSEAAENELTQALKYNPQYWIALLNLAALHEFNSRRQEALECYRKLLEIEPECYEGLARYAILLGAASANEPIIKRLSAALNRPGVSAREKASLGFALGKLLDGCRLYDEAFEVIVAANSDSRASRNARKSNFDHNQHTLYIDRIIAAFPKPIQCRANGTGQEPIFICGMYRSGSTLIEQVLAAHTLVEAGGEINYVPELVRQRLTPFPDSMLHVSDTEFSAWAKHYKHSLPPALAQAAYVTDKRPDNFLYIGLIKHLFPDARIVHSVRDPLDNGLAIYFQNLDPIIDYALDLQDIGHYYAEYRRLMDHWKLLFGKDIFDVHYDTLVREPKPIIEKLLEFCGLAWEDNCLNFFQQNNAVRTASVWQVRQKLYLSSSGRSQHYERQLTPLKETLTRKRLI